MSAKYHTPFVNNAIVTSLAINQRFSELDSAIFQLRHGFIGWEQRGGDPAAPPAGYWRLYFKSGGLYRMDSAGVATPVSALGSYACIRDEKAQGTNGGTFTSGAWRTRDLNTEQSDEDGIVSIAANQFTLAAGTYRILAHVPAYIVNSHQARLQNITDATTEILGSAEYASDDGNVDSLIVGSFTITAAKVFEIQHRCQTTNAADGFGRNVNVTTEIYTIVELWKV